MVKIERTLYPLLIGLALLGAAFTTALVVSRTSLDVTRTGQQRSGAAVHLAASSAQRASSVVVAGDQDITPAHRFASTAESASNSTPVAAAPLRSALVDGSQDIQPALFALAAETRATVVGPAAPDGWRPRPR